MRLHRLSMTAFGPFAGTEVIDFDRVGEAGLFLVHGPTGAGKTSILDAVCFALYAAVPGARPAGRSLRSDHAPRDTVPQVVLEFTASGRRFRLTRSPEFSRPKRRGPGETKVPAKVILEERIDGAWAVSSSRNDEAAEVIDDVIGMGLEQFSRVVLLPQGDFAAFLRASVEERRQLLERLFDVSVYVGVEQWLADRRRAGSDEVAALRSGIDTDLARLADVLARVPDGAVEGLPLPQDDDGAALAAALPGLLAQLRSSLTTLATTAMTEFDAASAADRDAAETVKRSEVLAVDQRRGTAAAVRLAELDSACEVVADQRARLGAALRAAALAGDLKSFERAQVACRAAEQAAAASASRLSAFGLDDRSAADVAGWRSRIAEHGDPLVHAVQLQRDGQASRLRRDQQLAQLRANADRSVVASAEVDTTLAAADAAREALAKTVASAATVPVREAEALRAGRLAQVRREIDQAASRRSSLSGQLAQARGIELDAREHVVGLREARLGEMAGELAETLADGQPCPVCGSADHPSAASRARRVSPEDIIEADTLATEARNAVAQIETALAGIDAAQAARAGELGDADLPLPDLEEAARASTAELALARQAASALAGAEVAAESAITGHENSVALVQRLREESTRLAAALAELDQQVTADEAALAAILAAHRDGCACSGPASAQRGHTDLGADESAASAESALAAHRLAEASADRYLAALAAQATATEHLSSVERDLAGALSEHGFDSPDAAIAARLPAAERSALEQVLRDHDEHRIRAESVLADPAVVAAMTQDKPDLAAAAERAEAARAALLAARERQGLAESTLREADHLGETITLRCESLGPALSRQAQICEMADLVAGTGAGNEMRMRLSSFVLAARLERVVQLANERLAQLGDGRYQLEHDDGLAARGARSGLGLLVRDEWTGQSRVTSTLSGGESFMASLALALGLADAVREEAGGFDLQTLFIDEGFGSLDEGSLEQVMAVLDALRDGGRAVGVVSHVSDLRARICSQITVAKTPHGSAVSVTTGQESSSAA